MKSKDEEEEERDEKGRTNALYRHTYRLCTYVVVRMTVYILLVLRGHCKDEIAQCRWLAVHQPTTFLSLEQTAGL